MVWEFVGNAEVERKVVDPRIQSEVELNNVVVTCIVHVHRTIAILYAIFRDEQWLEDGSVWPVDDMGEKRILSCLDPVRLPDCGPRYLPKGWLEVIDGMAECRGS